MPRVDILIDDGGHTDTMQILSLKAMWEHLSDGGVYLIEDIHGVGRPGSRRQIVNYVSERFIDGESGMNKMRHPGGCSYPCHAHSQEQMQTAAVTFYHYVCVLEKAPARYALRVKSERHGTMWQPPELFCVLPGQHACNG